MKTLWGAKRDLLLIVWMVMSSTSLFGQGTAETDLELEVQLENRYFFRNGLYDGQERNYLSLALLPEYSLSWDNRDQSIHANLFFRWDQYDNRRTHFDIRELYYQKVEDKWEWSIGLKKIFWGVTESIHLVDIINQTDQIESFDGEQKLGQPMFHASFPTKKGTFDFFYLPYARKRQFPGNRGRLRFPEVIDKDEVEIDSEVESFHPSFALRWSQFFGPVDLGLSNFYGVGREPLFEIAENQSVRAYYPIINQTGLDLQVTTGAVLWKLEGIYRYAKDQDFMALAAGFEYTFGNIASSGLDIGILGEYLYDSRDELAISNLENDLFLGTRLAFNDAKSTEFLAGAIIDLDSKGVFYSVEASRRIGHHWKAALEARLLRNVDPGEFAYFFRRDSFLQFRISKFF